MSQTYENANHLYEAEHRAEHLVRPGFRIHELKLSPSQSVPWHYHNHIRDTFYVLEGEITLYLRDPKDNMVLKVGDSYQVEAKRPHLVRNTF
ncbi:MAG: cupin domain-containing protein, partial [Pseudomonadota bacterium]